jgi:cancer susceptibility candidate protein 1
MTLRQPATNTQLVKLSYPLKNISQAQPPLAIRFSLDPDILTEFTRSAAVVMITEKGVTDQHIQKSGLDEETCEMTFTTMGVGTFGLALPRYMHFPFEYWELTVTSPVTIEIYVKTAVTELAIYVNSDGLCSMESPLRFTNLNPCAAVKYMTERGLNLAAPNSIPDVAPKQADLEDVLAVGIADIAIGFVITWSKWNAMLPADRAMLVMRERQTFEEQKLEGETDEEEDGEDGEGLKKAVAKPIMKAILVKANHIVEVPNTEDEEECIVKPIEHGQIHQHILPMFLDAASPEVKQRVQSSPAALCDAILYFMRLLRLFSMTK